MGRPVARLTGDDWRGECGVEGRTTVLRKLLNAMSSISSPTSSTPRLPRRSDSCCSWSCRVLKQLTDVKMTEHLRGGAPACV